MPINNILINFATLKYEKLFPYECTKIDNMFTRPYQRRDLIIMHGKWPKKYYKRCRKKNVQVKFALTT